MGNSRLEIIDADLKVARDESESKSKEIAATRRDYIENALFTGKELLVMRDRLEDPRSRISTDIDYIINTILSERKSL